MLFRSTIIAIVLGIITFFAQIKIPSVPMAALDYIADMNTPMAMLVSGVTIAGTNVIKLVRKPRVYYISFLKLLAVPAILVAVMSFLSVDERVKMTVIVAASAPPAAMCTLQCIRYNRNSIYASEIFAAGTILSVATLPIVVKMAESFTKMAG